MPTTPALGTGDSILGAGFVLGDGTAGAPTGDGLIAQDVFVLVLVNGMPLPGVLEVTIDLGMDITVPTASIMCVADPSPGVTLSYDSEVVIFVGCGNNISRFRGLLKEKGYSLWPHTFKIGCRGMLSRAEKYQQPLGDPIIPDAEPGLRLRPASGRPDDSIVAIGEVPIDELIVLRVLNRVPGLVVDPPDIRGTSTELGELAEADLTWTLRQTALEYIQGIDRVSLGYRTFESLDGRIYRFQVFGYPNTDAEFGFVEGLDIWEAEGTRSIEDLYNAVFVEGYNLGQPALISLYVLEGNDIQGDEPHVWTFSSPLIERINAGDPGAGFSAEEVANWQLSEVNREIVRVTLTTFRDWELGPGQTITVLSPHSGLTQPMFLQHLQIRAASNSFTQTIQCLGGGDPGNYITPPIR